MFASRSEIPPAIFFEGFGRRCFLTWLTRSTSTWSLPGKTRRTFPWRPLSLPAITTTRSCFLSRTFFITTVPSQNFWSERDDLHELLLAQFPGHRAEDARSHRFALRGDEHRGVVVEPDVRTVFPSLLPPRPDDHGLDDPLSVFLDERRIGRAFLHRRGDHVSQVRISRVRAAALLDARDLASAGIVGNFQHRSHLDHGLRLRLPENLAELPPLSLRKGARLLDGDPIADRRDLFFVVSHKSRTTLDV